jgi:hypothetical protein
MPITMNLWNPALSTADLESPETRAEILEQYKVYVEMADRVSARRSLANAFFLTLNTAVFAAVGALLGRHPEHHAGLLAFPSVALIVQCAAWYYTLRSYQQLNRAKYRVIGAMEERLPASPYWRAEWSELGEGRDKSTYWPLTHVELWIPALFGVFYAAGYLTLLIVA